MVKVMLLFFGRIRRLKGDGRDVSKKTKGQWLAEMEEEPRRGM